MRISVVGAGYVGLVSGACLADVGHTCVCVDNDAAKVASIRRGIPPIHESGLEDVLKRVIGTRLDVTSDLSGAVRASDLTLIAVGTPFREDAIDLSYVRTAAAQIGAALRCKAGYHAVVVKSTVVPGTTDDVVRPILEEASGKQAGVDFGLGMNPEFLTEGVAIEDFMRPDRIVLGGIDDRTIDTLAAVYEPFAGVPVLRTNNKTAEMIKYASNSVLATLISFSNEIGNLCQCLGGVDAAEVMAGVHQAHYFTPRLEDGRRVPAPITNFLWPGCGFGGSCLPKDVKALSAQGRARGQPMSLLDAVMEVNRSQPARVVGILEKHLGSLRQKRVCVLGLAFRPDTDDVRESPAIPILRHLVDRGAIVSAYDPVVQVAALQSVQAESVSVAGSLDEAVTGVDALVLVTRWEQFRRLPALLEGFANPPLLVDGRRMLDKRSIPRYAGVGT
ncbi:MAG: UDP-glucose/GDP-mannose dehydrogenase family protein [Steroidobacteraceae bacterium]